MADDQLRMTVYCAGNPMQDSDELSHQDQPFVIESFVMLFFSADGSQIFDLDGVTPGSVQRAWSPDRRLRMDDGRMIRLRGARKSKALLVGNRIVTAEEIRANPRAHDGGRSRYNFRCSTCGLGFVRQSDAVDTLFDRLVVAGVPEISLSTLVAMLRK